MKNRDGKAKRNEANAVLAAADATRHEERERKKSEVVTTKPCVCVRLSGSLSVSLPVSWQLQRLSLYRRVVRDSKPTTQLFYRHGLHHDVSRCSPHDERKKKNTDGGEMAEGLTLRKDICPVIAEKNTLCRRDKGRILLLWIWEEKESWNRRKNKWSLSKRSCKSLIAWTNDETWTASCHCISQLSKGS